MNKQNSEKKIKNEEKQIKKSNIKSNQQSLFENEIKNS